MSEPEALQRARLARWQRQALEGLLVSETPGPVFGDVPDDLMDDLRGHYPRVVRRAIARHLPLYAELGEPPLDDAAIRRATPRYVGIRPRAQLVASVFDLVRSAAESPPRGLVRDALLLDRARALASANPLPDGATAADMISRHRDALQRLANDPAEPEALSYRYRDLEHLYAIELDTTLADLPRGQPPSAATSVGWSRWVIVFAYGPGPTVRHVERSDLRREYLRLAFEAGWSAP